MSKNYPIIIVHNGCQEYLDICLKQAHFSNPNSRIILIGKDNSKKLPFVEYYESSDYFEDAAEFENKYRHFSCNAYQYELFCFQRWFIINDFIKKHNITHFLHIDSDVLLYSDFSKEKEFMKVISQYDMTLTLISGHTSFFNSQKIIEKLCEFISDLFLDEDFFEQFNSNIAKCNIYYHKKIGLKAPKPLSDMTLLYFFANMDDVIALNMHFNIQNGTMINSFMDKNIAKDTIIKAIYELFDGEDKQFFDKNYSIEYASFNKLLNVLFNQENVPYIYNLVQDRLIRMHSLHFQGNKKCLMRHYCTFDKIEPISCIPYTEQDIKIIFGITSKIKTNSFRNIIFKIIAVFIPSKILRNKLRQMIVRI